MSVAFPVVSRYIHAKGDTDYSGSYGMVPVEAIFPLSELFHLIRFAGLGTIDSTISLVLTSVPGWYPIRHQMQVNLFLSSGMVNSLRASSDEMYMRL
jgi:hypothetical protein